MSDHDMFAPMGYQSASAAATIAAYTFNKQNEEHQQQNQMQYGGITHVVGNSQATAGPASFGGVSKSTAGKPTMSHLESLSDQHRHEQYQNLQSLLTTRSSGSAQRAGNLSSSTQCNNQGQGTLMTASPHHLPLHLPSSAGQQHSGAMHSQEYSSLSSGPPPFPPFHPLSTSSDGYQHNQAGASANALPVPPSVTPKQRQYYLKRALESFTKEHLTTLLCDIANNMGGSVFEEAYERACLDLANRKVFVRGIAWGTTSDSLGEALSVFGTIQEAAVICDRVTGKSKGYAFVTFDHGESAFRLLELPYISIDGRNVQCFLASQRGSGSGASGDTHGPQTSHGHPTPFGGKDAGPHHNYHNPQPPSRYTPPYRHQYTAPPPQPTPQPRQYPAPSTAVTSYHVNMHHSAGPPTSVPSFAPGAMHVGVGAGGPDMARPHFHKADSVENLKDEKTVGGSSDNVGQGEAKPVGVRENPAITPTESRRRSFPGPELTQIQGGRHGVIGIPPGREGLAEVGDARGNASASTSPPGPGEFSSTSSNSNTSSKHARQVVVRGLGMDSNQELLARLFLGEGELEDVLFLGNPTTHAPMGAALITFWEARSAALALLTPFRSLPCGRVCEVMSVPPPPSVSSVSSSSSTVGEENDVKNHECFLSQSAQQAQATQEQEGNVYNVGESGLPQMKGGGKWHQ